MKVKTRKQKWKYVITQAFAFALGNRMKHVTKP